MNRILTSRHFHFDILNYEPGETFKIFDKYVCIVKITSISIYTSFRLIYQKELYVRL